MSLLRKGHFGLKPYLSQIFTPKLKHGVSIYIIIDTVTHLPLSLGRGYRKTPKPWGFSAGS